MNHGSLPRLSGSLSACLLTAIIGLVCGMAAVRADDEATAPSSYSAADERFHQQLDEAYDLAESGAYTEAVDKVLAALRTPELSPEARRHGLSGLSWIYYSAGRHRESIDLLDQLLKAVDDPGERAELLQQRASAWAALGDHERASADRTAAEETWPELAGEYDGVDPWDAPAYPGSWSAWVDDTAILIFAGIPAADTSRTLLIAVCAACLWGVLWFVNILIGRRQMREGAGTFPRLVRVAAYAALLECFPVVGLLIATIGIPFGASYDSLLMLAFFASLYSIFWLTLYLRPPVVSPVTRDTLPPVEDPEFLSRLGEIAQRIGIPAPVARKLSSGGGVLGITAYAGGMVSPSIIVSDGVLLRITREERDAIVAHELGHIANRTLLVYPVIAPVSATVGALSSLWLQPLVAILYGLAFQVGLTRIISRVFEYDCDRRAGRAIGTKETITALQKTYAVSPIGNSGWWSFLAFATATHPSIEERLSALRRLAGPDEEIEVTWSETAARRRRWGARCAAGLWLALMIAVPRLVVGQSLRLLPIVLLAGIACAPFLLLQRAIRRDVRTDMRRRQVRPAVRTNWLWLGFGLLLAAWVVSQLVNDPDQFWTIAEGMLTLGFAGVLLAILFASLKTLPFQRGNLHAKVIRAIYAARWDEAIAIAEKSAKQIRKNPSARNDLALARWMAGQREPALNDLAQLRREYRQFRQPWLTSAILLMDQGSYQEALDLLSQVAPKMKADSAPHVLAARCHRLLGNIDGLIEQTEQVATIDPGGASSSALKAQVALEQGDSSAAWKHLVEAEQRAPGDTFVTLLRAEVEFKIGSIDKARAALADAERMLTATPLAFLRPEYEHVRRLLSETGEVAVGLATETAAGETTTHPLDSTSDHPPE